MAGNIIVTTTVNKVTWSVDQTSYGKALKQIRSLKKEWEKTGQAFTPKGKANSPVALYAKSATQARLVNKRLQQTERSEQAKTTAHSIAMAKKEANARASIARTEAARRKQAVGGLTAKDPELKRMKEYYSKLGKTNKGFPGSDWTSPHKLTDFSKGSKKGYTPSGNKTFGSYTPDPEGMARQMASMRHAPAGPSPEAVKQRTKDAAKARKEMEAEDRRYSKYLAGKESTVANAGIRLRAKYGDSYAKKMPGFDSLKERFLDSNTMKSSNFRAELAAMEQGLRNANKGALSFSDGINTLRRSVISLTAVYGAFSAGASVLQTGMFFQGMEAQMSMVSSSSKEAGDRMKYVQGEAYRLGLDLKEATSGYTKMAVAANGVLDLAQQNKLFTGLSEYATAQQMDSVTYGRSIKAIQQMLSKGRVTAEELRGQLGDAMPGALKIFQDAAKQMTGKLNMTGEEFESLMRSGKLVAKDMLPIVADMMAKAARNGGALDKSLAGTRVALARLTQSWMMFQNEIFEAGFGEKMTETFNNLAFILSSNGPLATAVGSFATGFIDAFMGIFYAVYNTFIDIKGILQTYIPWFRTQADEMSTIWNWAGMAVGAIFFASSLGRVFSILSKIVGLSGPLKGIGKVFGAGGIDEKLGKGNTPGGKAGGNAGLFALAANPYILAGAWGVDYATEDQKGKEAKQRQLGNAYSGGAGDLMAVGGAMLGGWWDGLWGQHQKDKTDYLTSQGIMPGGNGPSTPPPMVIPTEPVSGEITIKLDAGEMKNMIDQQIDAANMGNINLLLGVPE